MTINDTRESGMGTKGSFNSKGKESSIVASRATINSGFCTDNKYDEKALKKLIEKDPCNAARGTEKSFNAKSNDTSKAKIDLTGARLNTGACSGIRT